MRAAALFLMNNDGNWNEKLSVNKTKECQHFYVALFAAKCIKSAIESGKLLLKTEICV